MRRPTAIQLLAAWEQALPQSPARRALTLFALACPELPVDDLAARTVAERDGALLSLHHRLFGSEPAVTGCPACDETLEFAMPFAELCRTGSAMPATATLAVDTDGFTLELRPPAALDVAVLPEGVDAATARRWLATRCVVACRAAGVPVDPPVLSEAAVEAISRCLAEADALGDLQFELICPSCRVEWPATLDAGSFLWLALDAWAGCQLREVHQLASAYGWSEAEILGLTPERRRAYLDLVNG